MEIQINSLSTLIFLVLSCGCASDTTEITSIDTTPTTNKSISLEGKSYLEIKSYSDAQHRSRDKTKPLFYENSALNFMPKLSDDTIRGEDPSQRHLYLPKIERLSASTASAIAKFDGESILLDDLRSLNKDSAKQLALWNGKTLSLGGLLKLDVATAT